MKMIILNGSARRGNTYAAIQALKEGASEKHEVEVLDAEPVNVIRAALIRMIPIR